MLDWLFFHLQLDNYKEWLTCQHRVGTAETRNIKFKLLNEATKKEFIEGDLRKGWNVGKNLGAFQRKCKMTRYKRHYALKKLFRKLGMSSEKTSFGCKIIF